MSSMKTYYLEFEQPIAHLEAQMEALRTEELSSELSLESVEQELQQLELNHARLIENIYKKLTPWQIAQVARHPNRPHTLDYMDRIFTDFDLLCGDRVFGEDAAIVGGLAHLKKYPVMVIGHQKGRTAQEKVKRNFGMPRPEGYRKALRLMQMAERFGLPIITFIDTPGAYPGIDAEERGQSEAIARNIQVMSQLQVPIITLVIGEGGSGGALAIGVCDHLMMLQYSTYSVISPEGCASILWKNAAHAETAASAMALTAEGLQELNLIDDILEEPLGGAHRDTDEMARRIQQALITALKQLENTEPEALLAQRYERIMAYGALA